jgi:hypothetical protein
LRAALRARSTCSSGWPARPTAGWLNGWRARWARSTRRRRTGARPATHCSGCWPARPAAGGLHGWQARWARLTDSPRPQDMARLGGPTDRRTACCGAPELGTYQLACSPPLAGLAFRFTRLRHRKRQPQSRSRTPKTAARSKIAGHASGKLQRKVAETTTCDHALAVLAGTGRARRIRNTASCHNRLRSPNRSSRTGAPVEQRSGQERRTGR